MRIAALNGIVYTSWAYCSWSYGLLETFISVLLFLKLSCFCPLKASSSFFILIVCIKSFHVSIWPLTWCVRSIWNVEDLLRRCNSHITPYFICIVFFRAIKYIILQYNSYLLKSRNAQTINNTCLLYTSDAADE